MIEATAREAKAGRNVVWFQVRKLFEYLLSRQTGCQKIEDVGDPNPHAANAWAPATLRSVDGDPIGKFSHREFLDRRYHNNALT